MSVPIVRGKCKAPTEFGAKIGESVVKEYIFIDHHSWDAYNEESDLEFQIDLFRKRLGYFPARVYADKIYMNRDNRWLVKNLEIKAMGKPWEDRQERDFQGRTPEYCGRKE